MHTQRVIRPALLVLLVTPVFADWQQHFHAGERLLSAGRTDDARRELTAALAEVESTGENRQGTQVILNALGMTEFRAGRSRPAASYLQRALTFCENRSESQAIGMANVGLALLELGDNAGAEKLFRRSLEIMPKAAEFWHSLGQAVLRGKRYAQAEIALQKALALWDKSEPARAAIALSDLAFLYRAQKRTQLALETYEKAIAMATPGQRRARIMGNLGVLSWRIGKRKEAASWLSEALTEMERDLGPSHPDNVRIMEDYSFVLQKSGRGREARAMENRAQVIRMSFAAQTNDGRNTVHWETLKRGAMEETLESAGSASRQK